MESQIQQEAQALYDTIKGLADTSQDAEVCSVLRSSAIALLCAIEQAKAAGSVTEQRIYYSQAKSVCARISLCLRLLRNSEAEVIRLGSLLGTYLQNTEPVQTHPWSCRAN